jgi:orotate phosphoribosyltransferase-like protein
MEVIKVKAKWVGYPIVQKDITSQAKVLANAVLDNIDSDNRVYNLICTGTSGLYLATLMLATYSDVFKIIYIRKEGEGAHSGNITDTVDKEAPCIWVDDFICTGATMERVFEEFNEMEIQHIVLLGSIHSNAMGKVEGMDIQTLITGGAS